MKFLRIPAITPIPLFTAVVFAIPLLFLSSCAKDSGDQSGAQGTEATAQGGAEEPVVYSDVPEAQAAFDESIDLWGSDGWASLARLKEAVALDPDFVEARGLLSMRYAYVYLNYDRSDSIANQARMYAEEAMALDPENRRSLNAMGNYYYRVLKDYPTAVEYYGRGAELYPEALVFLRMQAYAARRAGDWDRSLALLLQADGTQPSLDAIQGIAEDYEYNRRWDEAVAAYQEHQRRNPESTLGPYNLARIAWIRTGDTGELREFLASRPTGWAGDRWNMEMLDRDYEAALAALDYSDNEVFRGQNGIHPKAYYRGVSQKWMGDEAAAEASFQEARQIMEAMLPDLDHDCRVHAGLADIYANLGMPEEAVAEGMRAVELVPVEMDALTGPPNHMALARVYSVLGDADAAVEELRYLLSIPSSLTRTGLRLAPVWDPIREDPAFQALLEE